MRAHRPRTPFHLLRASAVATVILTLAAGAHVTAGGELPAPAIMLAVLALTALASTTVTRLKLEFPGFAALLLANQLVLHEVFTVFSPPAQVAAPTADAHHDNHFYSGGLQAFVAHLSGPEAGPGPVMPAAHGLATLACALLLAKGESALWALAAWLRPLATLPCAMAPEAAPPASPFTPTAAPLRPWRNLRQDSRRGPPSAAGLPC